MITVFLILQKQWEYDDSFYNFAGNQGLNAIALSRRQADEKHRALKAQWVRDHRWSLSRFEEQNMPWDEREALVESKNDAMSDDEALALAAQIGVEPFTVQEVVITPEFLHAAGLSPGKRTELMRALGERLKSTHPEVADHLEGHHE